MASCDTCTGCSSRSAAKDAPSGLLAWLKSVPAQDAGVPGAVVCIASNESLSDALLQMKLHSVLSLPLINMSNSQVVGMVDMNDIVAYVVDHMRSHFKCKCDPAALQHASQGPTRLGAACQCAQSCSVEKLLAEWAMPGLVSTSLDKIAGYSGVNAFVYLPPTASLWEVLELMNGKHVHRVALVEQSGRLAGLVTQSTIIKYLAQHKAALTGLLATKIGTLPGASTHMIVACKTDRTAFSAFDQMRREKVSAVAVVDANGHLRAVLSNRDLKSIGTMGEAFDALYKPVMDYLTGEQLWHKLRDMFTTSALTYRADEPLEVVLDRVVKHRVHRLCITDDAGRPTGVLSLGDLIRMVRHAAVTH